MSTAYFVITSGEDGIVVCGPLPRERVAFEVEGCKILDGVPEIDRGCFMVREDSALILRGEVVGLDEVTLCPCHSGKAFKDCHGSGEAES